MKTAETAKLDELIVNPRFVPEEIVRSVQNLFNTLGETVTEYDQADQNGPVEGTCLGVHVKVNLFKSRQTKLSELRIDLDQDGVEINMAVDIDLNSPEQIINKMVYILGLRENLLRLGYQIRYKVNDIYYDSFLNKKIDITNAEQVSAELDGIVGVIS